MCHTSEGARIQCRRLNVSNRVFLIQGNTVVWHTLLQFNDTNTRVGKLQMQEMKKIQPVTLINL